MGRRTGSLVPQDLFVFVGAGASLSMPSGRPMFGSIRDAILEQLGLETYIQPKGPPFTDEQEVVDGLAPEPFVFALQQAGVRVDPWFGDVLAGGSPNAALWALSELAKQGAAVWTVNFDTKIEDAASRPLSVCAWPSTPAGPLELVKPHGSLSGELIAASPQVLRGLHADWEARLRTDVAGRTVVFLGYSGNDLDFQPVWGDVVDSSAAVLWFDRIPQQEVDRRARMLRLSAGRLQFLPPAGGPANPSLAFVEWCRAEGLADVDQALVDQLDEGIPPFVFPPLPGSAGCARATVLQILGDARGARRQYLGLAFGGPDRRRALGQLVALTLNHGGRPTAAVLALGARLPARGALRFVREVSQRKRASIFFNLGRHEMVERATRSLPSEAVSTLLVLRTGSLRMTGSLDEAVTTGTDGLRRARDEQHPVRAANAALQLGIALVWAGQLDHAEAHVHEELRPLPSVADTRWVAWADFVEALVHVHRRRAGEALAVIEQGLARFRAEGLLDGVLGMEAVRLTAQRLAGADSAFACQRGEIERFFGRRSVRSGRRYSRGHRFSREAVLLEDAEFARIHEGDLGRAVETYSQVADSAYPVHAALANLGLASVEVGRGEMPSHAAEAARLGRMIGAALVVSLADGLAAGAVSEELYFP